jgi:hypothetical protein
MTLSPMEPNVSDNSCLGLESIQVCRLRKKRPSTTRKDPCSGYESSERAKFCCQRPRSIHKANRRSSGFRGCQVARDLARGSSNGSKQTWVVQSKLGQVAACRHIVDRGFGEQGALSSLHLEVSINETPKAPLAPSPGSQHQVISSERVKGGQPLYNSK